MKHLECLIIGGGPAGLTAALYLGRFNRSTLLVDAGASRTSWIPKTHNLIGYKEGVSGPDLLERMRDQTEMYGAELTVGEVSSLDAEAGGGFMAMIGSDRIRAERVLLATGGLDVEPELPGIRAAVRNGLVRYCPICDAFEVLGRRVGLISYGKCRVKEALLLRGYTADLTVMTLGQEISMSPSDEKILREAGVKTVLEPITQLSREGKAIVASFEERDISISFDVVYSALGTRVRSGLAIALGAEADEDGALHVDSHQRTTVPGLFAAGDVVTGLSQISIAAAQAAIAATTINAELAPLRFPLEHGTQEAQ
jgi:thioredoxin reductase (NADPH)